MWGLFKKKPQPDASVAHAQDQPFQVCAAIFGNLLDLESAHRDRLERRRANVEPIDALAAIHRLAQAHGSVFGRGPHLPVARAFAADRGVGNEQLLGLDALDPAHELVDEPLPGRAEE